MTQQNVNIENDRPGAGQATSEDREYRGPHHILAASSLVDERTRVLKQGDTFAVFDHYGDIKPGGLGEEGLYHEGTRYLSCLLLELEGSRPFFLSSTVRDENDQLAVALTNPDLFRDGRVWAPLGTLHLALKRFLWRGVCYQQLQVKNHGLGLVEVSLALHFAADYADIYEVRGLKRKARGEDLRPEITGDRVVLGYRGLDRVVRRTLLQFTPQLSTLTASTAQLDLSLRPQQQVTFCMTAGCERQPETRQLLAFDDARTGEMAVLKEMPFGRYYGSVDATPLFVLLAGAYYERTGDRAFVESLWPHVEAALLWIDHYGDQDGDGFVEYHRQSTDGLLHQGWKDSDDAVFHADGSLARGPIALCEVQGYVYAARQAAATLATVLGQGEQAVELVRQAEALRERFEEVFWCEELATYALALDGDKRPCRVRTSNAGQCLFTGIVSPERARHVAWTLLHPESFSGWGVRTVAASEVRYNPMAYHNGSVWPQDNALIAQGLARYGLGEKALQIMTGLFEAGQYFDLHRMPELFCGFPQDPGEGPVLYPVACAPQAWAAASVLLLIQACLGLEVNGPEAQIYFTRPCLPASVSELRIHNLEVAGATVDLLLVRHEHDVGVTVMRRDGDVQILVVT